MPLNETDDGEAAVLPQILRQGSVSTEGYLFPEDLPPGLSRYGFPQTILLPDRLFLPIQDPARTVFLSTGG